jgi:outer membrane protein OmpA-like peptidoglycan-associated protein
MRHFLLIILVCFCGSFAAAQVKLSSKSQLVWNQIKAKTDRGVYDEVLPELEKFVKQNPEYLPGQELLAQAYIFTAQYEKAVSTADLCIKMQEKAPLKMLALKADALQGQKKYLESLAVWEEIKLRNDLPMFMQKQVATKIPQLKFIDFAVKHPVEFNPENVGGTVNTPFHELYPLQTPDGQQLYFTRMNGKQEDLFVAQRNSNGWDTAVGMPINTPQNEGAYSISADGQFLFLTACNRSNGLGSCDIFYSLKTPDGWSVPMGLGNVINTVDWESQPSFSADGQFLFFSAIREGGYGGKDLWFSQLTPDKKWLTPKNLGPEINTPLDEETPFFHADGKTLYFSSNGHPGMGYKDIFISKLDKAGKFTQPLNLGYPINTESDESGLTVAIDGKTAFLASDRPGGFGRLDIYKFELPEAARADVATYVRAYVKDQRTLQPVKAQYRLSEFTQNRFLTEGSTDANGSFLACLPVGATYALTVENSKYLFHSEHFELTRPDSASPYILEILLQPIDSGFSIVLKNVLFQYNSATLLEGSFTELQKIKELLSKNPGLKVEISGHTDNVGSKEFNLQLSQKRAESVVQFLVSNGIDKSRLIAVGYGETRPIADNSSEAGRTENRRTEMKIDGR